MWGSSSVYLVYFPCGDARLTLAHVPLVVEEKRCGLRTHKWVRGTSVRALRCLTGSAGVLAGTSW